MHVCRAWEENGKKEGACKQGAECNYAHGPEELAKYRERQKQMEEQNSNNHHTKGGGFSPPPQHQLSGSNHNMNSPSSNNMMGKGPKQQGEQPLNSTIMESSFHNNNNCGEGAVPEYEILPDVSPTTGKIRTPKFGQSLTGNTTEQGSSQNPGPAPTFANPGGCHADFNPAATHNDLTTSMNIVNYHAGGHNPFTHNTGKNNGSGTTLNDHPMTTTGTTSGAAGPITTGSLLSYDPSVAPQMNEITNAEITNADGPVLGGGPQAGPQQEEPSSRGRTRSSHFDLGPGDINLPPSVMLLNTRHNDEKNVDSNNNAAKSEDDVTPWGGRIGLPPKIAEEERDERQAMLFPNSPRAMRTNQSRPRAYENNTPSFRRSQYGSRSRSRRDNNRSRSRNNHSRSRSYSRSRRHDNNNTDNQSQQQQQNYEQQVHNWKIMQQRMQMQMQLGQQMQLARHQMHQTQNSDTVTLDHNNTSLSSSSSHNIVNNVAQASASSACVSNMMSCTSTPMGSPYVAASNPNASSMSMGNGSSQYNMNMAAAGNPMMMQQQQWMQQMMLMQQQQMQQQHASSGSSMAAAQGPGVANNMMSGQVVAANSFSNNMNALPPLPPPQAPEKKGDKN